MNILSNYIQERFALFQNRAFCFYLLSCAISTFGNGMCYLAMSWLVLKYISDLSAMVILMTCFWISNIILGPFFGVLADRYDRKYILLISNFGRALLIFLFWYLFSDKADSLMIFGLALFQGVLFASGFPASMAIVRDLVPPDDLLYANATIDTAYEIGNVVGMGAVGFIIAMTSIQTTFFY